MTPVQRRLLKRFAAEMEMEGSVNPIYAFTVLTKVCCVVMRARFIVDRTNRGRNDTPRILNQIKILVA